MMKILAQMRLEILADDRNHRQQQFEVAMEQLTMAVTAGIDKGEQDAKRNKN